MDQHNRLILKIARNLTVSVKTSRYPTRYSFAVILNQTHDLDGTRNLVFGKNRWYNLLPLLRQVDKVLHEPVKQEVPVVQWKVCRCIQISLHVLTSIIVIEHVCLTEYEKVNRQTIFFTIDLWRSFLDKLNQIEHMIDRTVGREMKLIDPYDYDSSDPRNFSVIYGTVYPDRTSDMIDWCDSSHWATYQSTNKLCAGQEAVIYRLTIRKREESELVEDVYYALKKKYNKAPTHQQLLAYLDRINDIAVIGTSCCKFASMALCAIEYCRPQEEDRELEEFLSKEDDAHDYFRTISKKMKRRKALPFLQQLYQHLKKKKGFSPHRDDLEDEFIRLYTNVLNWGPTPANIETYVKCAIAFLEEPVEWNDEEFIGDDDLIILLDLEENNIEERIRSEKN